MNKRRRYQRKRVSTETKWLIRVEHKFFHGYRHGLDDFDISQWIDSGRRFNDWHHDHLQYLGRVRAFYAKKRGEHGTEVATP
jgi:hypothetical protein